ncbi:MAG: tail fiber assembly protein [Ilumatobacteraceae bacterium]
MGLITERTSEMSPDTTPFDTACVVVVVARNEMLAACDWTQQPDSPLNDVEREAWRVYRRELRDITNQPGFPFDVVEPVSPEGEPKWTQNGETPPEVAEAMRIERERLESLALEMQAEIDRNDVKELPNE